jgi:hypothetical protein
MRFARESFASQSDPSRSTHSRLRYSRKGLYTAQKNMRKKF